MHRKEYTWAMNGKAGHASTRLRLEEIFRELQKDQSDFMQVYKGTLDVSELDGAPDFVLETAKSSRGKSGIKWRVI